METQIVCVCAVVQAQLTFWLASAEPCRPSGTIGPSAAWACEIGAIRRTSVAIVLLWAWSAR